ncbi:MAG: ABC transporter permease [Myxococcota bacterium]
MSAVSNTIAIFRKELGVYFTTAIAYAGFGAFAFLTGLLFVGSLNRYQSLTDSAVSHQQPEMLERLNVNDLIVMPMFSTAVWMFLFFVPFLTMRLFAEEKSQRTFELLMSAPLKTIEIVAGKFLAVAFMMLVMSGIPMLFPAVLGFFTTGAAGSSGIEWTPIWSATLSLFLLGLCFAALGLFFSSLSSSQLVAALFTFAALLLGFVLPILAARLEGDWRVFLEFVAPTSHVGRGLQGRIHIQDLVYFGTTTLAFLVLTHRVVESERWR